ncbi:7107_t:CDS:2 [Paraglomus brasilianum]|uniref:7107_t:CDS:1 n=1 Tax=Paraglomus brasilianum TaxID=144538 RepID=A0A9N9CBR2_9GLOM|nr:7107_t:CDS:2 [Paraglomus brasilianum]
MNDDAAFDSEFKVKEDALNKKRSDASLSRAAIMKDEDKKNLTLEMIKGYFDEYVKHLELEDTEKNDLAEIEKAIAEPDKYKDAPQTPVVSEADLKAAFGNIDEDSDNKSSTKTAMKDKVKNKDTDDEERLDMTNYGATEKNGEPDEKGSGHKYYKIKGESNGGNGGNGGDTKEEGVLAHLKAN